MLAVTATVLEGVESNSQWESLAGLTERDSTRSPGQTMTTKTQGYKTKTGPSEGRKFSRKIQRLPARDYSKGVAKALG